LSVSIRTQFDGQFLYGYYDYEQAQLRFGPI
jgi:hypothetical protein